MERSSAAAQRAQALRAHFDSPTLSPPPSRQASLAALNTSSPTPSRSSTPTPLPEIDEASRGDEWSASDAWEAAVNGPSQQRQQQRKPPPQRMHLEVPHHPLEHHRLSPAAASSPLLGGHDDQGSDYFVHATSREQAAASSPVTPTASRPRAPRTPSVFATPNVPATIEEGSEPGSPVKRRFSGSPHRDDENDSDGDSTKSGVKSEGSHPRIVEPDQAERQPSIMDLVSAAPSPEQGGENRARNASPQEEAASTPVAEVKLHTKPSMNDIAFPRADAQDELAPPPAPPASTSPPPSSSSEATASPLTGDRGDASPQLRHQLSLSPSSSSSPLRRFIKRSFSRSSSNSMRSEAASTTSSSSPKVVRRNAPPQTQDEQKPASPSTRRQLLPAPPARDSSLRANRRRRRSSASLHDEPAPSPAASPPQEVRTRRLSASLSKSWRKRLSSLSIKREGKTPARLSLASLFDRNEVVVSHDDSSSELQQEEADLLAALEGEAAWLNGQGSLERGRSVNVPAISQDSASSLPSGTAAPSRDPSLSRPAEQLSPLAKSRPLLRRKHAQRLPEPLASRPASVGSSTIRGHRQSTASSIRPPSLPTTPMTIAPPPPPPRSLTRKRSMSHSGVTRLRPELLALSRSDKREELATTSPPTAWRFHATDMAPSRSLPVGEWTSAIDLDLGQSAVEDDAATTILSDGASASPETPRRPRLASLDRPTQSHESALPRTLRARLRLSQQESTLPPPVEFNVEVERRRSISERATRPRPTSLVLGPFDLQVPDMPAANDETSKEALRSLRHRSLPAALNIREKVLARRQYRRMRRSVDLALGLSVPLQLSFAAGLGWNEQATTVDDASESEATSADTDEAVTAPNTATFPSVDEERGANADEEQQRRIAARKLSMDLLEGKASARQRATPSPSPVPVQPRSSSMAMAMTVASLVDGPEWSAGKMRATIRRANTLAGPASAAASTSSFYASASWSDVANLHSISQAMLAQDIPSYISARSANSIISESRPTRIQAETLQFLNRILDELLLFIVASSRSLATDRIKTNGLLRVMNNNVLAKDAVLEAELELRNYLQGKKAEGGRVPLGLSATSRWDGTEAFPVASAYNALRTRCQYYSTLGDREDEAATGDQHIMSAEGRPIATITPGVSIYVTALLEFVGEYILQHVAAIIERDNSDEAGLADLRAAIEEDEQMITLWRQMVVKQELEKRLASGGRGGARRSIRPWKVPQGDEVDEAATDIAQWRSTGGGSTTNSRIMNRPGTSASINAPPPSWPQRDRSSSLGHGQTASDSYHHDTFSDSHASVTQSGSQTTNITTPSSETPPPLARRTSIEKGLSGIFGSRRRGSFKQSQDGGFGQGSGSGLPMARAGLPDVNVEPADDFEALMMSGQTMKVSLTPNRLRTIEVERMAAESKKESRQRPGVLNFASLKGDGEASTPRTSTASPAPSLSTLNESARANVAQGGTLPRKSGSRVSNPPSSYRGPADTSTPEPGQLPSQPSGIIPPPSPPTKDVGPAAARSRRMGRAASTDKTPSQTTPKLQPRDKRASWSAAKDMMDLFNTTPPSPGMGNTGKFSGVAPEAGLAGSSNDSSLSRVGGKMRALLGGGGAARRAQSQSNSETQSPSTSMDRSDSRQSATQTPTIGRTADEPQQQPRANVISPVDFAATSSTGHGTSSSEQGGEFGLAGRLPGVQHQHGRTTSGVSGASSVEPEAIAAAAVAQRSQQSSPADPNKTPSLSPPAVADTPAAPAAVNTNREDGSPTHAPTSYRGSTPSTPLAPTTPSVLDQARPDGPPSRKIPIGRRASRDEGHTMLRRRASVRSQMSDGGGAGDSSNVSGGGGGTRFERANGTSSAMGFASHTTPMSRANASLGPGTPTSPVRPLNGGGAQRSASSSSSAPTTLRVLAGLDRSMRTCTSVEECRALVATALNAALRDATNANAATMSGGTGGETASGAETQQQPQQQQVKGLNLFNVAPPATDSMPPRAQPVLIMSNNYDEDEDESSPAFARNGSVAAWLLDDYVPSQGRSESPPEDGLKKSNSARMTTSASLGSESNQTMRSARSALGGSSSVIGSSSRVGPAHHHSSSIPGGGNEDESLSPSRRQASQQARGLSPPPTRSRKLSTNTVDEQPNMYASADEGDLADDDYDEDSSERSVGGRGGFGDDDDGGVTADENENTFGSGDVATPANRLTPVVKQSAAASPAFTSTTTATTSSRSQRPPPSASKAAVRLARQEGGR